MIETHNTYYPLYKDKSKFIILVTGGRGCEKPDQRVMMADLTTKAIKDIKVGDKVMGDDGTPRTVLDTHKGYGKLYYVQQSNADDYVVNDGHILCLKKGDKEEFGYSQKCGSYRKYPSYPKYVDMPIEEYISKPKSFQRVFRGYKCGSIPYPEQAVKIDPYMLGVWLGDGTSTRFHITNPDKEIIEHIYEFAKSRGMKVNVLDKEGTDCKIYSICYEDYRRLGNPLVDILKEYGIFDNKHIPQEYISNSEQVRLELLAGLLDTDGYYDGYNYEIIQKNEKLARQIKFVADTLGLRTSIRPKQSAYNGKDCGTCWRVTIEGDLCRIPCKVTRKKANPHNERMHRTKTESSLRIRECGYGEWVGIYIDGNHHYLHEDGTEFHNSGKSYAVSTFIERLTFEYNPKLKLAHKILYSRYTMVSAAISVIPEVYEKIDADGTEMYFKRTKTDIVNRMTGAEIMFRGIHTSSGNQTAKLKSIQGITTFVVDEAEEWTSEEDFERIMLSIRQQGLQNRIIIIMNPADSSHWVYRRFIEKTHKIEYFDGVPVQISTHPNVLHIHTTYLDNIEHLAPQFLNEVLEMKEKDPERYAHIVIGRWADVAEGAIYKNVGICEKFPENAKHVARGIDFGYSCFSGDTLIFTLRGNIPISQVTDKDYVLTRRGWHKVMKNVCRGKKQTIIKKITIDGENYIFHATYEHNFNANGKWKKYGVLTNKDTLCVLSCLTEKHSADTLMGNTPTTIITNEKSEESSFGAINTPSQSRVVKNVQMRSRGIKAITTLGVKCEDVYDLTIEGVNEYFANGILVHNCDPTAIVRCGIVENRLYIDELCYKPGMTSQDLINELRQEQDNDEGGFVYADSADPRLIDEIALGGIIIYPVKKGAGSILAGISKMQTYEIVVTKRSENVLNEMRNYVWAKDKDGNYINEPIDAYNHACFVGETPIQTESGAVPIKDMKVGMNIMTSDGLRKVVRVFDNGEKKVITARIYFGKRKHVDITATPDHLFKTERGWIRLKDLKEDDVLYRCVVRDRYYFIKKAKVFDVVILSIDTREVYNLEVEHVHEFFAGGMLVHNCDAARYYILGKIMGRVLEPKTLRKKDLGVY